MYAKDYLANKKVIAGSSQLIWCRDAAYYASAEWRGKKSLAGGGVMINQAIHYLDFLQNVCGMPETVKAFTYNSFLENVIEVEDTAYGLFTLKNGSNFIINATNASRYSFQINTKFATESETLEISGDNILLGGEYLKKKDGLPLFAKEEWGVGHYKLVADFYGRLKKGEKFPIDFYEAEKCNRLVLKMYESQGKEIPV